MHLTSRIILYRNYRMWPHLPVQKQFSLKSFQCPLFGADLMKILKQNQTKPTYICTYLCILNWYFVHKLTSIKELMQHTIPPKLRSTASEVISKKSMTRHKTTTPSPLIPKWNISTSDGMWDVCVWWWWWWRFIRSDRKNSFVHARKEHTIKT